LSYVLRLCLALFSLQAAAMDAFEIQVYTNDINAPGQSGLEIHTNYIPRGNTTPAVFNGLADHHLWHNTLEFSRGISESIELGLYYQTAFQNDQGYYAGTKLRVKYLPKFLGRGFAGLNIEVGRSPVEFDPDEWGSEMRPIFGYDGESWLVSFNPILGFTLGKGEQSPEFEPAIKIGRHVSDGFMAGIEYYAELGKVDRIINAISEQTHNLFLTFDKEFKNSEINFGIGRGTTPSANDYTIKMIIGLEI
jgi:hypothetical protein